MENILITGVSSGIGRATVQYFLDKGFFVYGSVRKEAEAKALQSAFGNHFFPLVFDVCEKEAVQAAAALVKQKLEGKGLAALVNNAGIAVSGPLSLLPVEEVAHQLEVNVLGVIRVTQAFLPLLGAELPQRENPGKIFNISSISGEFAAPFLGPYCASKYALEAINDSWRRELLIYGIDVICIQPGPIRTPIWQKAIEQTNLYPDSDYGPILKSTTKTVRKSEASSIAPERVAQVIFKALKRSRPRARYMVARNAWLYQLFFRLVPARWVDFFINKSFQKRL